MADLPSDPVMPLYPQPEPGVTIVAEYIPPPSKSQSLIERLRDAGTNPSRIFDDDIFAEAADEIERLRDCLQRLVDVQNGCPLPKYELDWRKAMSDAAELIDPARTAAPGELWSDTPERYRLDEEPIDRDELALILAEARYLALLRQNGGN